MNKRIIPAAAGLVILYAAVFQLGVVAPMLVPALSYGFNLDLMLPAVSLLVSLFGLAAVGYCAAAERPLAGATTVWALGCFATLVSFLRLGDVNVRMLTIAVLQLVGGPAALLFIARTTTRSAPPMRRELGALLLVMVLGTVLGSIWFFVHELGMFHLAKVTTGSMLGILVWPFVSIAVAAFGLRAALALLSGDHSALIKVTVWKWVSIGTTIALSVLSVVSFALMDRHVPFVFMLNPLITGAFALILPLAIGRLAHDACAQPVDPRDATAVPTVLAWAALWLVPLLFGAMFFVRVFLSTMVDSASDSTISFVAAICGFAAILLLATAVSVMRAMPIARLLTGITAALSVCALVCAVYAALQADPMQMTAMSMPVGAIATFAAAMVALAWFEARREPDLAPARVVS